MARPSNKVIYAALIGNLLIAATKFIAAAMTGSSAMMSEGIHSTVDSGNELLLLFGKHRAAQPPDPKHPFGYGREIYFWSFIVALLVFSLGALLSFHEGIAHIQAPRAMTRPDINYVVLGLSMLFEGLSWAIAMREFLRYKGRRGLLQAARESKDPTHFIVLFEDSAALLGLLIALICVFAAQRLHIPELDGVGSLGIGVVLTATAIFLARETKALLIGESASARLESAIVTCAGAQNGVQAVNGITTVHLGPQHVMVALSIEFDDALKTQDIEAIIRKMEQEIYHRHAEVTTIFIKPQIPKDWQKHREALSDPS